MAIPALLAAVVTGGGVFGASTAISTYTVAQGFLWKKIGLSFIMGAFSGALAYAARPKDPTAPTAPEVTSNISESVSPARFAYGESRVGGAIFYAGEDDKDLWMVMGLSEGPCEEITGLYIDDEKQEIRRSADGVISISDGEYSGHFLAYEMFRADGSVNLPGHAALRAGSNGEWTVDHRLYGISYVIIKLTQGEGEPYQGIPEINFILKGRKIVYPGVPNFDNYQKKDSNDRLIQPLPTPMYTNNAAAVAYDYCVIRRGIPVEDIDTASFTSAIATSNELVNVRRPTTDYMDWPSTEINYAFDGTVFADDAVNGIMDEFRWCLQGNVYEFNGQYYCNAGKNETPSISIGDADIQEFINLENMPSRSDRVNRLTMQMEQSWAHDYQNHSLPVLTDEVQLKRDDGEIFDKDIGTRSFTTSPSRADRMMRIAFKRSRQSLQATFKLNPQATMRNLHRKPEDKIFLTHSAMGLNSERFNIISTSLEWDFGLVITAEEFPEGIFDRRPGLGDIPGRNLRIPRFNHPPEKISASDITAFAYPRVSTDGTYHWKVQVSVPGSAYGFRARLTMGSGDSAVSDEKGTFGSTIEFGIDAPRETMTIAVWRVNQLNKVGEETEVNVEPQYSNIALPVPRRISWRDTPGNLRIEMEAINARGVKGADFRFTRLETNAIGSPSEITEQNWDTAGRFDSRVVLLQSGLPSLFNLNFADAGKYRIYARYVDAVDRLGPLGEMGEILLTVPVNPIASLRGAPDWPGTKNRMIDVRFGSDTPLLPDTKDDPSTLSKNKWNVPVQARQPDRWEARVYPKSGSQGSFKAINASNREEIFSNLTNGVVHEAQFRAVYNGVPTDHDTIEFTPTATASAPTAPTFTGTAGDTTITGISTVGGVEDKRAPILRHEYRVATSIAGLSTATWTSVFQF